MSYLALACTYSKMAGKLRAGAPQRINSIHRVVHAQTECLSAQDGRMTKKSSRKTVILPP